MCIYTTLHYLSLGFDIIDFNSYYTKEVADTVVGILEREQHSYLRLGVYFIFQWMAGLIIFITTNTAVRRNYYHNVSCSTASVSGTLTGSVG